MKESYLPLLTKEADLLAQFGDATQAIEALRLDQEFEFTIGNAFVRLSHTKQVLRCDDASYPKATGAIFLIFGDTLKNTKLINYLYELGYTMRHQDSEWH
jgi:hypothetical protein